MEINKCQAVDGIIDPTECVIHYNTYPFPFGEAYHSLLPQSPCLHEGHPEMLKRNTSKFDLIQFKCMTNKDFNDTLTFAGIYLSSSSIPRGTQMSF